MADLVVVISERLRCIAQQGFQPSLAIHKGQGHQILPAQEQQIEQEENQRTLAGIAGVLDQIESRPSIGEHTTEFAIKVGGPRLEFGESFDDYRGIWRSSRCPGGSGFEPSGIEPGVHPISVKLDLVQPA